MVSRWLLAVTLTLQVTFAVGAERTDYRDWEKTRPQVVKNWNSQFDGTKKQAEYLKNYASGRMDTMINQINNEHKVRTMIRDSGIDPDTGKKIRIEANVTQTANKAKVASTLVDRLAKAKDYAKHVGKASIPSFVGMAAFEGLMKGIDYVMDEGGKVTQKAPVGAPNTPTPSWEPYRWVYSWGGGPTYYPSKESAIANVCKVQSNRDYYVSHTQSNPTSLNVVCNNTARPLFAQSNPNYNPSTTKPDGVEVTPAQLQTALEDALKSNNPALAAAIAEAIKAAYTPESPIIASIGDEQSNGLAVGAADSARDAVNKAANNTGSEPSSEGKPGYYKITDGEKTVEGYVYPSDTTSTGTTDSTTTTNPDGSTTTTGTTAQEWPAFCDWAGIVCEFIDWVKEDEQIEEDEPEEIDDSIFDREFDIKFEMAASCPPNPTWNFQFVGQQWSKEINITSICDFFRYIGYAIVFASNMTALWIVYAAVTVREQG